MGSGFLESSFETGLGLKPHFIGCDAGSTDPGPEYLGSGRTAFPKDAIRRDLRLMLLGARRLNIPLLIGSAGTGGNDLQLELVHQLVREIAATEGLSFRLALIHAEQDKAYLRKRMREGRIEPLAQAEPVEQATPAWSSAMNRACRSRPTNAMVEVVGRRAAALPMMMGWQVVSAPSRQSEASN